MFVELGPGSAVFELLDVGIPLAWSHDCDLVAGVNSSTKPVVNRSSGGDPLWEPSFPTRIRNTSRPALGVCVQGVVLAWVGWTEADLIIAIKAALIAELIGIPTTA